MKQKQTEYVDNIHDGIQTVVTELFTKSQLQLTSLIQFSQIPHSVLNNNSPLAAFTLSPHYLRWQQNHSDNCIRERYKLSIFKDCSVFAL